MVAAGVGAGRHGIIRLVSRRAGPVALHGVGTALRRLGIGHRVVGYRGRDRRRAAAGHVAGERNALVAGQVGAGVYAQRTHAAASLDKPVRRQVGKCGNVLRSVDCDCVHRACQAGRECQRHLEISSGMRRRCAYHGAAACSAIAQISAGNRAAATQ